MLGGILAKHVISARALHPANAPVPMRVTELPMVTLVRPVQPENAEYPMLVTELGMVTLVKPVQKSYLQLVVCQIFSIKTVEK